MKQIQPINSWINGQLIQGTIFNLTSTSDNLTSYATFFYQIFSSNNISVASGYLTMTGFDYQAYSTSPDSNAYAYQWGATQLNLTLI